MKLTKYFGVAAPLRLLSSSITLVVALSFSIGCSETDDSADDEPSEEETPSEKVYLSEVYGYAVTLDEDGEEAVAYSVVDGRCWEQPIPQDIWWASPRDDETLEFDYLGQKQPPILFERVGSFEDACPQGTIPTAADDDYVPDLELEYELFQRIFTEHYAFFDLRGVDWDDQVAEGEAALSDVTDIESFFDVMSASVAPLQDGHIYIEAGEGLSYNDNFRKDIETQLIEEALAQPDAPEEDPEAYIEEYLGEQFMRMESALVAHFAPDSLHGTLEDPMAWALIEEGDHRFGYFWMTTFADVVPGGTQDSIDALHEAIQNALSDWGDIDGVIVDVRINQGGWDVLGRALMSHFVEEETLAYEKRAFFSGEWTDRVPIFVEPYDGERYDGPVAVLSGRTTISAAETFVLGMRSLDRVTVVGEATYGILSDSLPKFLPSGIYFSLSNEEYTSADGEVYERAGVPPHVETDVFSLEDRESGRDSALEAAISALVDG